jgi:hypothetical protein
VRCVYDACVVRVCVACVMRGCGACVNELVFVRGFVLICACDCVCAYVVLVCGAFDMRVQWACGFCVCDVRAFRMNVARERDA